MKHTLNKECMKPQQNPMDQVLAIQSTIFQVQATGENTVEIITTHNNQVFAKIELHTQAHASTYFSDEICARVSKGSSKPGEMRVSSVHAMQSYLEGVIRKDALKAATTLDDKIMSIALFTLEKNIGLLKYFPKKDRVVSWKTSGNDRIEYGNMQVIIGADKSLTAQIEHRKKVYTKTLPFDLQNTNPTWSIGALEFFVATRKNLGLKIDPYQVQLCSIDFQKTLA